LRKPRKKKGKRLEGENFLYGGEGEHDEGIKDGKRPSYGGKGAETASSLIWRTNRTNLQNGFHLKIRGGRKGKETVKSMPEMTGGLMLP